MGRVRQLDHLVSDTATVWGRPASFASGGDGLPVLFLHGWGLDHRAYRRSLKRLTGRGCRVLAPSLPGFGGTAGLKTARPSLDSYSDWVAELLNTLGEDEPFVVMGHSFGGGVATQFAHDHGDRVRYLVLLNSVGDPGAIWGDVLNPIAAIGSRSLGQVREAVGSHGPFGFGSCAGAIDSTAQLLPRIFVENLLKDPAAVAEAAWLAVSVDLTDELTSLADRDLPLLLLWSDRDEVIPLSAFDTFCSTLGSDGTVVRGGHSWLLAEPEVFGQVLENVLHVQYMDDNARAATADVNLIRELLRGTSVPERTADSLVEQVSPLWVLSAPPAVLAADLTLCHPALEPHEVRAVARPLETADSFRLTVVGRDRPGLLADTTELLADNGIWVESASATTWTEEVLALHAITVRSDQTLTEDRWAAIGAGLQEVGDPSFVERPYVPSGRADAILTDAGDGRFLLRVTAPDGLGLLSNICRWLADEGVSVEAANVSSIDGVARNTFLVDDACDVRRLARSLSTGRRRCRPVLAWTTPRSSGW